MMYVTKIIKRFGGIRAAATVLGLPPTTVQSWKEAGHIPAKHQAHVLEAGKTLCPPLIPADFFDAGGAVASSVGAPEKRRGTF